LLLGNGCLTWFDDNHEKHITGTTQAQGHHMLPTRKIWVSFDIIIGMSKVEFKIKQNFNRTSPTWRGGQNLQQNNGTMADNHSPK
jgi:hypothetical protein